MGTEEQAGFIQRLFKLEFSVRESPLNRQIIPEFRDAMRESGPHDCVAHISLRAWLHLNPKDGGKEPPGD